MEFGIDERGREGGVGRLDGREFSGFFIGRRVGVHGRAWSLVPPGEGVFLLLMELAFAGRGRN